MLMTLARLCIIIRKWCVVLYHRTHWIEKIPTHLRENMKLTLCSGDERPRGSDSTPVYWSQSHQHSNNVVRYQPRKRLSFRKQPPTVTAPPILKGETNIEHTIMNRYLILLGNDVGYINKDIYGSGKTCIEKPIYAVKSRSVLKQGNPRQHSNWRPTFLSSKKGHTGLERLMK
jgi:hypothetical protein